ncbi:hypothetical protein FFF34_005225 [Inquilinus sp. KBS0705]|nr:hypothetical protein FFF34_005225 [Inquilinus sp. KBS0705]
MKELTDEDLQRMMEGSDKPNGNNVPAAQKNDFKAYQLLFSELNREPEFTLPANFAAKVARQVQAKAQRDNLIQFFMIIAAVFTAGCTAIYYLLIKTNKQVSWSLKFEMAPYKWAIVFIIVSLLLIQYIDQKLVKEPKGLA